MPSARFLESEHISNDTKFYFFFLKPISLVGIVDDPKDKK